MMTLPLPDTMRAWVVTGYGGPEVLSLKDVALPRLGANDVLIEVEATTVSAADHRIRAMDMPPGMGVMARAAFGFSRPRQSVLGTELTGIVVAVGPRVLRFAVGDAVIAFPGAKLGGHAEYCRMRETGMIVQRPANMSLECAAALCFGGTTARDFLRRANLGRDERVLVIGAAGTVGSAMVQLALLAGANVSAVTSAGNADLMRGLGVSDVIDYTSRDITSGSAQWDIVADCVAALTFQRALPMLAEGGRYLSIAGGLRDLAARRKGTRRPIVGPASEKPSDMAELAELAAKGLFRPLIDSLLPFEQMPEAHVRVDTGRKRGSVVVRLVPGISGR
jgi:NADPH:quinone reductase-like Zn-dependent oxidoreductase